MADQDKAKARKQPARWPWWERPQGPVLGDPFAGLVVHFRDVLAGKVVTDPSSSLGVQFALGAGLQETIDAILGTHRQCKAKRRIV